ncbi:MAG: ABC transporter ATP-binding protein [Proteobacteria bacterium]|nr:ABC transporter ATP-binding protein [Pseudomonadota bacterium]
MTGGILVGQGLTRRFDDGQRVIEVLVDVSLEVERGESVAVVGESGVGKSTLLHLLSGLDNPDSGRVMLDGQDLFAMDAARLSDLRNRSIGFVFQFHHLMGDFDAVENVMMPLLIGGMGRTEASGKAVELLERVGLGERLNHRPAELSGGEQQRVAVARALVTRPAVVFADEPTGNLDPQATFEVQQLLDEVRREADCAMVVATHDPAMAARADRVLRLANGTLLAETPAGESASGRAVS